MISRRRALLTMGAAALALAGQGDARRRPGSAMPRLTGATLPMNVHPLGGRLTTLQRAALRRLHTPWIRVTLGLVTETMATRPYVGAAPNLLGLVSDFHQRTVDPASWPDMVEATLRRYPEITRAELLNEPAEFYGLAPAPYVHDFLRPGFERLRERFPSVAVVAAAPIGNRRKGLDYFRRMTDAGADRFCDYRGVHVYFEDERTLSAIRDSTDRPILVTETGIGAPRQHVRWAMEVIPRIREVLKAELVFWYVLLESAALALGPVPPNYHATSLIAADPDDSGQPKAAAGSRLYPLLVAADPARDPAPGALAPRAERVASGRPLKASGSG
jgi:hypothetical protein